MSLGFRVRCSITGFILIGDVLLFIFIASCILFSDGSGIKSVHVLLSALRVQLFVYGHVYSM